MSGTRSATGLMCSHGSELDAKIPRPKQPKCALPPDVRRKLGLPTRIEEDHTEIWKAGSGVLKPSGSGRDGNFLKMKSGVPLAIRGSRKAQLENGGIVQRANVSKPRLLLIQQKQESPNAFKFVL